MVKMDRAYLYEFFAQLNIEEINPRFNGYKKKRFNKIFDTYDEVFGGKICTVRRINFGVRIQRAFNF